MVLSLRVDMVDSKGTQSGEVFDFLNQLRRYETRNQRVLTTLEIQELEWEHKEFVMNYFVYHQQSTTIAEYESSFFELKRWAETWSEENFDEQWVVDRFVTGLKEEIRSNVERSYPRSLNQAINLAKWQEMYPAHKVSDKIIEPEFGKTRQPSNQGIDDNQQTGDPIVLQIHTSLRSSAHEALGTELFGRIQNTQEADFVIKNVPDLNCNFVPINQNLRIDGVAFAGELNGDDQLYKFVEPNDYNIELKPKPPDEDPGTQFYKFVQTASITNFETTKKKVNCAFGFLGKLDMTPRLSEHSPAKLLYDLSAVLNHKGSAVNNGHYVAHIKDENTQQWWEFDDKQVSGLGRHPLGEGSSNSTPKLLQIDPMFKSSEAYMLMYILRCPKNHGEKAQVESVEFFWEKNSSISSRNGSSLPSHLCEEELYFWISRGWLRHWADNITSSIIDNTPVQCLHRKVPVSKFGSLKWLLVEAWDRLISKHGGGPTFAKGDCCTDCIIEKAQGIICTDNDRDRRTSMRELAEAALVGRCPDGLSSMEYQLGNSARTQGAIISPSNNIIQIQQYWKANRSQLSFLNQPLLGQKTPITVNNGGNLVSVLNLSWKGVVALLQFGKGALALKGNMADIILVLVTQVNDYLRCATESWSCPLRERVSVTEAKRTSLPEHKFQILGWLFSDETDLNFLLGDPNSNHGERNSMEAHKETMEAFLSSTSSSTSIPTMMKARVYKDYDGVEILKLNSNVSVPPANNGQVLVKVVAGYTVVIKPFELTPLTALATAELAFQAGIPPGAVNMVMGNVLDIGGGGVLLVSPQVRKITFTGLTVVGKKLMAGAVGAVKKVSLELDGNAPCIIFDDVDLEVAIKGTLATKFHNSGQICVCADTIIVQEGIYGKFVSALSNAIENFTVGGGFSVGVVQGPVIKEVVVHKVKSLLLDATSKGAKVLRGGKRHSLGMTFYEPTVIGDDKNKMRIPREEVFGHVAALLWFKIEEEAIHIVNDTNTGLAACRFIEGIKRSWRVAKALEYGILAVYQLSTDHKPELPMESNLGSEKYFMWQNLRDVAIRFGIRLVRKWEICIKVQGENVVEIIALFKFMRFVFDPGGIILLSTHYPGIGEFQCYDHYLMKSLKKAAETKERPFWGKEPENAGFYNSRPHETRFFCDEGDYDGYYGTSTVAKLSGIH